MILFPVHIPYVTTCQTLLNDFYFGPCLRHHAPFLEVKTFSRYRHIVKNCFFMNITSKNQDQLISIYFFGPPSSFPNMTARTIAKPEETANRNINILSSPKVYHSMIIPSYTRFQDGFTNYGFNVRKFLKIERWVFHCGPPWKYKTKFLLITFIKHMQKR